jgi:UDP-3-O-[3-hydroxymyristoyl] glucosamine N-acyltransferase
MRMVATVRELAEFVQGTVHGDGSQVISEAHSLAKAEPGHVTFVESEKHERLLKGSRASAVVVSQEFPLIDRTLIRVNEPLGAFLRIVQHLRGVAPPPPAGIDPRASIHPSVQLGPGCSIQAFAVVGEGCVLGARCWLYPGVKLGRNCKLGDDVIIYPNAVLYDGTLVGQRVIIHANAVLGADGFGYRNRGGKHIKVPQLGHVELADDVEIGACTTIDRGAIDATQIGTGTKIDNQVMIAHNCQIGAHNLMAAHVGIAGSSSTGSYVVMGGQAGVADHVHIGDQAILGARTGVGTSIKGGMRYLGMPCIPELQHKRMTVHLLHISDMHRDLQRIKRLLSMEEEKPTREAS